MEDAVWTEGEGSGKGNGELVIGTEEAGDVESGGTGDETGGGFDEAWTLGNVVPHGC